MKKPFEVGERVVVYDVCKVSFLPTKDTGTIIQTLNGLLRVKCDTWKNENNWFHHKQCRRIVKRKRREIWLIEYSDGKLDDCCFRVDPTKDTTRKYVRFIEAKEK